MSVWVTGYIARLLIGSFFAFAACALVGKSSHGEPVRFACACFMLLLILSPLYERDMPEPVLEDVWRNAQKDLAFTIEDTHQLWMADLYKGIDRELMALLQKEGILCHIELCYTEDRLVGAKLWTSTEQRPQAETRLAAYTGLPTEQISYMGEQPNGNEPNRGIFENRP